LPGIYTTFHIAKEALLTHQMGVAVTGHNIANVNTQGYTRQKLSLETRDPEWSTPGQLGLGVKASAIKRVYDQFLIGQYTQTGQAMGRWEAQKGVVEKAEMIFSDGMLSQSLVEFWNAWEDLSNNPAGKPERVLVIAKGEQLSYQMRNMTNQLEQIRRYDIGSSIRGTVDEINSRSEEIAALNVLIVKAEAGGNNANDLRDKRDALLKELSGFIDINFFEEEDGRVSVQIAGGRPLVTAHKYWTLSTGKDEEGMDSILWEGKSGSIEDITYEIAGGKLKGWIEARDGIIKDYIDKLNELAAKVIEEVNSLHSSGFGLTEDPSTGLPVTGLDFFSGSSAGTIQVNDEIKSDVNKIAAAKAADGVPGDNRNAIALADLRDKKVLDGGTATFERFYGGLLAEVGNNSLEVGNYFSHESQIMTHLDEYRESVSGVSIDEEMITLVEFQRAYEAAAKLITSTDELLQTLLAMV
jgi:flagellar hook-associated protein 1 FlgK